MAVQNEEQQAGSRPVEPGWTWGSVRVEAPRCFLHLPWFIRSEQERFIRSEQEHLRNQVRDLCTYPGWIEAPQRQYADERTGEGPRGAGRPRPHSFLPKLEGTAPTCTSRRAEEVAGPSFPGFLLTEPNFERLELKWGATFRRAASPQPGKPQS